MKEIWKDIPNYEGLYKVSNKGNVKSLSRPMWNGKVWWESKERILKPSIKNGYNVLVLCISGNNKMFRVHKLVAMAFLGHEPCGMENVIDHKNGIKDDNRVENLRIVTQRENANQKHLPSTSKYVGVSYSKSRKKWCSMIRIKNGQINLGRFNTELEAHQAYQNKLNDIIVKF